MKFLCNTFVLLLIVIVSVYRVNTYDRSKKNLYLCTGINQKKYNLKREEIMQKEALTLLKHVGVVVVGVLLANQVDKWLSKTKTIAPMTTTTPTTPAQ